MLKVLELFAGTRSVSRAFERRGHKAYTVEWDKNFDNITLYDDVNNLTPERVIEICGGAPDVIWASPDCTTYSLAAISHHRLPGLIPKTEYAKSCDKTNEKLVELIKAVNPKVWFIENPRGGLRKMHFMSGLPRYTVTYCQYGDTRMKPTDIWTNHPNPKFKPMCHNGDSCHEAAPRGSKTGTQGLKAKKERSRIPDGLCDHIVEICEDAINRTMKTVVKVNAAERKKDAPTGTSK